ncbi:MAG TPA: ferritin [Thermoanaerobacterales bacterium]|nr:ferritin [Thermoanaerobacterales bacterium]
MLSEKIEKLINEQIRNELFSGYLYLSMSAYLSSINLNGYANWFRIQAQEERDHAMIMYNYVLRAGGRVELLAIEQPKTDFSDLGEVLKDTLEHEKKVTAMIYNIMDVANAEKDYKTIQMLNWFVDEQVEEEENATENLEKYNMLGQDKKALYLLDKEMGARVYTPPAILTAAE